MTDSKKSASQEGDEEMLGFGGIALFASVLLCASAHLILRHAAASLNEDSALSIFFDWKIVAGLFVYGLGTALWIFCLGKLDLSLAFPASAFQFVLVFAGAQWILGESIPVLRLVGGGVILFGITLLFLERREQRE